ncbi:MAG: hypothetical protein DWQ29_08335 [Planctomycetota bacterium]|nr:MAG: hypothetical protein DWQ29_08335 [Planctomycetota bacterium]
MSHRQSTIGRTTWESLNRLLSTRPAARELPESAGWVQIESGRAWRNDFRQIGLGDVKRAVLYSPPFASAEVAFHAVGRRRNASRFSSRRPSDRLGLETANSIDNRTRRPMSQSEHASAWRPSVNTILVVGIETVAGANLAAKFAEKHAVVGLSNGRSVEIDGCETHVCHAADGSAAADWLHELMPGRVVYCGPEARSCWDADAADLLSEQSTTAAGNWAAAAEEAGCGFTMISSDGVFTGPWIFHDEESLAVCRTPEAEHIRNSERRVAQAAADALIVRTNVFGWSPEGDRGWMEGLLSGIESRQGLNCDCIRHASPLLATDLADILDRAHEEGIAGLYHIAGAERISPLQFAQRLADQFDLPWLTIRSEQSLTELPEGFGAGETSLQTKKVRKALCVAMPMLTESLSRLRAQQLNGYRDRISSDATRPASKVA